MKIPWPELLVLCVISIIAIYGAIELVWLIFRG